MAHLWPGAPPTGLSRPARSPAACREWPRTLARLAAWPLVSGQSASGGSMSRVAEGHLRGKREALLILMGVNVTIEGPFPGPEPRQERCALQNAVRTNIL